MEMAAACALAIISGRIILNFGFQESLRTFLKPIFTGGVWNELPQSKPDDFASFLGEGASGAPANFAAKVQSGLPVSTPSVLPLRGNPHSPFCRYATSSPGRGKSALKGTAFGGGDKVSGIAIRRPLGGAGTAKPCLRGSSPLQPKKPPQRRRLSLITVCALLRSRMRCGGRAARHGCSGCR